MTIAAPSRPFAAVAKDDDHERYQSPMYMDDATAASSVTDGDGSDHSSLDDGAAAAAPCDAGESKGDCQSSCDPNDNESNNNDTVPVLPHDDVPENPFENHGKLGTVALAVMVFYSVSGGPFGVESSVRSAGNFYTLLGFIVLPFVWSFQEAFMTAELGSAFPEACGGVAWVEEAFGKRAGWMSGYLGWLAGATDNSIYPVMFLEYLLQVVKWKISPLLRFFLLSSTSMVLALINWLGLPIVGSMSISICLIAMSPFFVLTVLPIFGVFKVHPDRWFLMPEPINSTAVANYDNDDDASRGLFQDASMQHIAWGPFLNNMFWNLNSFDAAASFAANIDGEPGTVFPRAMGLSVLMVTMGYLIPLLVTLGASDAKQSEWVDGYLATACSNIVHPWLGRWMVFAAGISNIALFQAELSADAFQLMGMADRGHLPKIFSQRSRHGTPTYGILLGTVIIIVMSILNLTKLVEMLNFNYAISLMMEYLSFIKLRITRPDLPRPYRVPMNTICCILVLSPTIICTLAVLCMATWQTYVFCFASNLVGMMFYLAGRPGACRIFASWFSCCCCKKAAAYSQVDASSLHLGDAVPPCLAEDEAAAAAAAADSTTPPMVDSDSFVLT